MKKNFLKFLLLGVFTLSLGAGFVGCKDYDDDINDLNDKVEALRQAQTDLTQLKTDVAKALADAEAANQAAQKAVTDATTAAIEAAEKLIAEALAVDGDISELIEAQIKAQLDALGIDVDAIYELSTDVTRSALSQLNLQKQVLNMFDIDETELEDGENKEAALKLIQEAIDGLTDGTMNLSEVDWDTIDMYISLINPILSTGEGLVLTTLVLEPTVWTHNGGRAIAFNNITYLPVPTAYVPTTGNHVPAATATDVYVSQEPIVNYAMNSKAVRASSIKSGDLKFVYKEIATRALPEAPTATYMGIENGNLQVKITAPSELFHHHNEAAPSYPAGSGLDPDSLDIVQLQVPLAGSNEIVSSDWGILYRRDLPKIQIAHTGKTINTYYDEQNNQTPVNTENRYFYTPNYYQATDYELPQNAPTIFNWYPDTVLSYTGTINLLGIVKAAQAEIDFTLTTGDYVDGTAFQITTNENNSDNSLTSPYTAPGGAYPYQFVNTDWTNEVNIEELGFEWKFEIVPYSIGAGNNATPQHQFVEFTNDEKTILKSRVYDSSGPGTAAIGRTPVIKASIIDPANNNNVVAVGYIKIEIVGEIVEDADVVIDFGNVPFKCDDLLIVTVERMNVEVYDFLATVKEIFHRDYAFDATASNPTDAVGTITEIQDATGIGGSTTYTLEWDLLAADLWANVGTEISQTAVYGTNDGSGNVIPGPKVNILLKATIQAPNVAINTKDIYTSIWSDDKQYFLQNTSVPYTATDANRLNNTFVNNVYGGFVNYNQNGTGSNAGQIKGHHNWQTIASDYTTFKDFYDGLDVTYYFTESNVGNKTFGGKNYTFSLSADKQTLLARVQGANASTAVPVASLGHEDLTDVTTTYATRFVERMTQSVANGELEPSLEQNLIAANGFDQDHYRMRFWGWPRNSYAPYAGTGHNYASDLALELLNTNEFFAEVGTKAYACADRTLEVPVGGDKAIFDVKFIKPVYTGKNDTGYWIDAVSGGSRVRVLDVIDFYDWRPEYFENWTTGATPTNTNANLYGFYGVDVSAIQFDATQATIEPVDGSNPAQPLQNANVSIEVDTPVAGWLYHNVYFVYSNNGNPISKDHLIKFPATLEYNWGTLDIEVEIVVHPSSWTAPNP